jgi:integrase
MKRNKGLGFIYQPKYKDRSGEIKTSPTWWVSYSHRGTKFRLSSNSDKRADAVRLLKSKLAEIGSGRPVIPDADKTTFEDLARILIDNYKQKDNKSIRLLPGKLTHLRAFFGADRARDIASDRIDRYMAWRLEEKAARATINFEVALLRRALRLALKAGKVASVPNIELTPPKNTRRGFFEREQFEAVRRHLPKDLMPVVHTAFLTGWRVDSEILTRKRHHLDLNAGWLRLEPGETKNGRGRNFPLVPELREVLTAQLERTRAFERATGQIVPWLFHREGKQIKSFRRSWLTACKLAGVPGRLRHDFRCTAVRNLERADISRSAAMEMVGHETEAIYRRYAIADEVSLREAGTKLAALHDSERRPQTSTQISQSIVKVQRN